MPHDRRTRRPSRPPVRRPAMPSAVVTLALVALVAGACGASGPTTAPSPSPSAIPSVGPSADPSTSPDASPTPTASVGSAQEQQLKAMAGEILAQVSELRGLDLKQPVETKVFDQAGLDAYVREQSAKETTPEQRAATQGIYRRLGLIGADQSVEQLEQELLGSQVLGLYDDKTKQLYVVARGDKIGALERWTMSHELDHALQDQHFDLGKLLPDDATLSSDVALAHRAVAEGDATLLMIQWATRHLEPAELAEALAAGLEPAQQELLAKMPRILAGPLEFPYTSGQQLAVERFSTGGWKSVDALYARPPASTEQLIHPEKYASGEAPRAVELPDDLAARMGAGWTVAETDTFGEYLISLWLGESGADAATAAAAAAGWGGDRLGYVTGPGGADAIVWRTTWDGERDADEFEQTAGAAVDAVSAKTGGNATIVRSGPQEVTLVLASSRSIMDDAVHAAGLRPAG